MHLEKGAPFRQLLIGGLGLLSVFPTGQAAASSLDVFHADSLAGPMKELKRAFEGKHQGVTINLTSGKGNPLGIRHVADLAKPGVKFVRVTGEKDLATNRTIEFLQKAAALEGKPELAQTIKIRNAATVPGTAKNAKGALDFVKFLLSAEGQNILKETGQPPVVPAVQKGDAPAELK